MTDLSEQIKLTTAMEICASYNDRNTKKKKRYKNTKNQIS